MPSKLDQLRQMSVVVADTGDIHAIKMYRPVDCTTNPSLVKAAGLPQYAALTATVMATAKLAEGIRVFAADLGRLKELLEGRWRSFDNLDAVASGSPVMAG